MGLSRVLGFCAALLFASSVSAANIIDVGPSDYRNFGPSGAHTSQGIRSTFGQQVRLPPTISGPTKLLPVSRNAVIPYGAAANAMRPFTSIHPVSAAASAAITGLFLAMEWYFDEEIGEWSVREVENIPPIEGTGWRVSGGQTSCTGDNLGLFPTPAAACNAAAACYSPPYNQASIAYETDTRFRCYMSSPGSRSAPVTTSGLSCPPGSIYNPSEGACQQYESRPVIEGEFSRLAGELPNLPAGEVAQGTADAQQRQGAPLPGYTDIQMTGPASVTGSETTSTSVDPVTGDTVVTTTSTTTNINYGDTTITTNNTTVTNTYTNGTHTSTTTTTETPGDLETEVVGGGGGIVDLPPFCSEKWAKIVCDWIGWTQEPPPEEPDLPQVIDDDFYEEKEIQFGAKSCPPDIEIMVPFIDKVVAVPLKPFCDFAGLIYYLVMAAAYIIAAYITVGVVRNG